MRHSMVVMSSGGHTPLKEWDTDTVNPETLAVIEQEFKDMMRAGYTPADITNGRDVLVQDFDPNADILMIPRMVGGCV